MDTKHDSNTKKRHGRHRPGASNYMISVQQLILRISKVNVPDEPARSGR